MVYNLAMGQRERIQKQVDGLLNEWADTLLEMHPTQRLMLLMQYDQDGVDTSEVRQEIARIAEERVRLGF